MKQSVSNKNISFVSLSVFSMCILFSSSALSPGTNGSCCYSLGLLFTYFPPCLDYSISTNLGVAVCFPNCIYACSTEIWVGRETHKSWMMSNHLTWDAQLDKSFSATKAHDKYVPVATFFAKIISSCLLHVPQQF